MNRHVLLPHLQQPYRKKSLGFPHSPLSTLHSTLFPTPIDSTFSSCKKRMYILFCHLFTASLSNSLKIVGPPCTSMSQLESGSASPGVSGHVTCYHSQHDSLGHATTSSATRCTTSIAVNVALIVVLLTHLGRSCSGTNAVHAVVRGHVLFISSHLLAELGRVCGCGGCTIWMLPLPFMGHGVDVEEVPGHRIVLAHPRATQVMEWRSIRG